MEDAFTDKMAPSIQQQSVTDEDFTNILEGDYYMKQTLEINSESS
jgi:hypothetical protein